MQRFFRQVTTGYNNLVYGDEVAQTNTILQKLQSIKPELLNSPNAAELVSLWIMKNQQSEFYKAALLEYPDSTNFANDVNALLAKAQEHCKLTLPQAKLLKNLVDNILQDQLNPDRIKTHKIEDTAVGFRNLLDAKMSEEDILYFRELITFIKQIGLDKRIEKNPVDRLSRELDLYNQKHVQGWLSAGDNSENKLRNDDNNSEKIMDFKKRVLADINVFCDVIPDFEKLIAERVALQRSNKASSPEYEQLLKSFRDKHDGFINSNAYDHFIDNMKVRDKATKIPLPDHSRNIAISKLDNELHNVLRPQR